MTLAAIADAAAAPAPVAYTGGNGAFRRLVMRGALLELITFGFYRFWLTTDIRRHLWSHTEIDGDALEYTGRGKELLVGFLIAAAVLAPFFLVYFLVGLELGRLKPLAALPLYLVIIGFGQFAAYRARRYRLTRTVWRGVRFWMTGSGWSYAWRSLLWGLLLLPTLGFAYPWRRAALERYKLDHTLYGTLRGRFEASGGQLFKRIWWVWLLGLLPLLLVIGGMVAIAIVTPPATRPPAFRPPPSFAVHASWLVLLLGMAATISLPFLHAVRRAREWAWWSNGLRFGDAAVTCGLRSASLIGVYWKLIGLVCLALLGFAVIAVVLAAVLLHAGHDEAAVTALVRGQVPIWGL
ncbi:MAG TPA: DUF898 family protein, partial [Stellaceae bacterium]|nr:DUF898 family protein [Stellaceae bacterium]